MSKNKLQKFDEMLDFPNVFQYPYAILQSEGGCPIRGRWNRDVFGNDHPLALELGCGRGEYTVGLGSLYPDKNFIGLDIKGARIWAGAKEAIDKDLYNVVFLRTSIELIAEFFAPGEVSEIWLTFPDPQMKKVNKRLTSARFMSVYADILKENGLIHLKTDSNFLFTYTKALTKLNGFTVQVCTDDLYKSGIADEILSIRTYYEQQWLDRGLDIKYMRFSPAKGQALVEPDIEIEPDPYRSFNRSRRSDS